MRDQLLEHDIDLDTAKVEDVSAAEVAIRDARRDVPRWRRPYEIRSVMEGADVTPGAVTARAWTRTGAMRESAYHARDARMQGWYRLHYLVTVRGTDIVVPTRHGYLAQ